MSRLPFPTVRGGRPGSTGGGQDKRGRHVDRGHLEAVPVLRETVLAKGDAEITAWLRGLEQGAPLALGVRVRRIGKGWRPRRRRECRQFSSPAARCNGFVLTPLGQATPRRGDGRGRNTGRPSSNHLSSSRRPPFNFPVRSLLSKRAGGRPFGLGLAHP